MNSLEKAALKAILNRVMLSKEYYDKSNLKGISELDADTYWGQAECNIDEAIMLLKTSIGGSAEE